MTIKGRAEDVGGARRGPARAEKPVLRLFPTTLWEYPSQHYDAWVGEDGEVVRSSIRRTERGPAMQGDQAYVGATPSWVIWQLLMRYTRADDLVVDPMCGSGTTIDVARDLSRRGLGYDLKPSRPDIFRADARKLPLEDAKADFVFIDPPYSTHIDYSDDPACIGKLDAAGEDGGRAYYQAMDRVFAEAERVMKPRRYMAVYVSDSWKKRREGTKAPRHEGTGGGKGNEARRHGGTERGKGTEARRDEGTKGQTGLGGGIFMPIGFELFGMLRERMTPVDMITVVRHNQKLTRGNWRRAAEEGNFFLRGFNYLMIFKKPG